MNDTLDLGWCQGYMGLFYHMEEALIENKSNPAAAIWNPPFALFSKKYYNEISKLNYDKIHDYCFIGSINSKPEMRQWVIEFAKKYFTNKSIFINTDNNPQWKPLGPFDYSNKNIGFCPKTKKYNQSKKIQYRVVKNNIRYFQKMCRSKYCLCPAGDSSWSFRFYEVLMCKSIPIVEYWHHTYRTREEASIKYKYILSQNIENTIDEIDYDEYVNENTKYFNNIIS
jgi:hypothetical protein